jgi:hypothetical protein
VQEEEDSTAKRAIINVGEKGTLASPITFTPSRNISSAPFRRLVAERINVKTFVNETASIH